jgi:glycosyltransferase involved in cell wall biosynthesis
MDMPMRWNRRSRLIALLDHPPVTYDRAGDELIMADSAATVVITTKNRKEELANAIASALAQDCRPRVLVIDDGSTDGTGELVREKFPQVRLDRAEKSLGYIAQRNRGAALADTPFIVSIDDDAVFSTPRVVSQTLTALDHVRVGAVAIPFVNVNQDNRVRQVAPDDRSVHVVSSYIGTAHALRRELFLRLGGYREFLFHQGEEEDYCLRMLAAGYVVRLGRGDPIHHMESPRRDRRRMDFYGRRNNVLFAWYNVPMPMLPVHLAGTTLRGVQHAIASGRFIKMFQGLGAGYLAIPSEWSKRRPVSAAVYRLDRYLRRCGPVELSQIEAQLPAVVATP